jgi:hypothetical protein
MKLIVALLTPGSLLMSHSILLAQLAQQRSSSLYERFMSLVLSLKNGV